MSRTHNGPQYAAGFTLIEVMIGMGLVAVLALAIAEMTNQTAKGQNNVRLESEFSSTLSLASLAMQNGTICTNAVKNLGTFNSANLANVSIAVPRISLPSGAVLLAPGTTPDPGLTISKLELNQFKEETPGTSYLAALHVEAAKKAGMFLGSPISENDVWVLLQTHVVAGTTVQIDGCGSASTSSVQGATFIGGFCAPNGAGVPCSTTVNWPTPFPDNNYAVSCTPVGPPNCVRNCGGNSSGFHITAIVTKAPRFITIETASGTNNQGQDDAATEVDCVATHL